MIKYLFQVYHNRYPKQKYRALIFKKRYKMDKKTVVEMVLTTVLNKFLVIYYLI